MAGLASRASLPDSFRMSILPFSSVIFLSNTWHTNELKDFLKAAGHKLVVVEFSAKWCGPCKMMCPIIQAMSVKYQNVMFANVDVDDSQELAESCHVRVVPTFQLFKQTKKVFEFCGADAKTLEEKIQELM